MGQGVLIVRAEQENNTLEQKLQAHHIQTFCHSMVDIRPCEVTSETQQKWLNTYWDGIILVSPNAVHYFNQQVVKPSASQKWPQAKKQYFTVGPGTGLPLLTKFKQAVTWPTQAYNSTALLDLEELTDVKNEHWLIINGAPGRTIIPDTLNTRGAKVEIASVYERTPKQAAAAHLPKAYEQKINRIIVSSNEQAIYFASSLKEQGYLNWAQQCSWVVPSQRIADTLIQHDIPKQQVFLAKSAMADDLVATTIQIKQEKKMPQKKQVSNKTSVWGRLFVFILFLSVIVLALGGGYLWQQQQSMVQQTEAEFDALRNRLSKAQRTDQEFEARLVARLEAAAAQQLARQNEAQNQSVQRIQQEQRDLHSQLQAQSFAQDQKISRLNQRIRNNEQKSHQASWQLNEAYARVSSAVQSLKVDQDRDRALINLEAAKHILQQDKNEFSTLVQQLENDIQMIQEYPRVDDSGLLLLLQKMQKEVIHLPLKSDRKSPTNQTQKAETVQTSNWRENLAQAWQDFSQDLIKIQKQSELPIQLNLEQRVSLTSRVELQLQLAQQALVKRNEQVFQATIKEVIQITQTYYDTESAKTRHFIATLEPLASLNISIDYPSQLLSRAMLQESLEALDAASVTLEEKSDD